MREQKEKCEGVLSYPAEPIWQGQEEQLAGKNILGITDSENHYGWKNSKIIEFLL